MPSPYSFLRPLLMRLPPETAHRLTIAGLRAGGGGLFAGATIDPILASQVFGLTFPGPVGIAAGFDKDAEVPDALFSLGVGFAEVGSVTPKPQQGNPRPRLFRLVEDRAVINRMGFNNKGADHMARRLSKRLPRQLNAGHRGIVGVNIGANKDSQDRIADYVECIDKLVDVASYFVINVSSPNTPGLRDLQDREPLTTLLQAAGEALGRHAASGEPRTPLLVKLSPDLDPGALEDAAATCLEAPVDGVILTNTTLARPADLRAPHGREAGGLSGRPLLARSTRTLGEFYKLTQGRLPLIGVGGVASGEDAYMKIRAGASLVQLYTALVFEGPGLIGKINHDLAELLRRDGFGNIAEAVGADHR